MAQLQFSPESLRIIQEDGKVIEVLWREVEYANAYLKDCLIVDQLRLEFGLESSRVTILADDIGFVKLLAALPALLPGFPQEADWFIKVTQPAFNKNVTTLYRKPISPS